MYRSELVSAGFKGAIHIVDRTAASWLGFVRRSRDYFAAKLALHQIGSEQHSQILATLYGGSRLIAAYVLVSAEKSA